MKKLIIFISAIFLIGPLFCNEAIEDSLLSLLDHSPNEQKVHILNELGKLYWGESTEKTF